MLTQHQPRIRLIECCLQSLRMTVITNIATNGRRDNRHNRCIVCSLRYGGKDDQLAHYSIHNLTII